MSELDVCICGHRRNVHNAGLWSGCRVPDSSRDSEEVCRCIKFRIGLSDKPPPLSMEEWQPVPGAEDS